MDLIRAIGGRRPAGPRTSSWPRPASCTAAAQWRTDFVQSENTAGSTPPQEAARVLAEAIDLARQGQLKAATIKTDK